MTVDNSTVDSVLKNKTSFYVDISGCRNQNAGFKTGEIMFNSSETCSQLVCSVESSGVSVSTCGSEESCIGNNMCVRAADVCTVTASSIIDFSSRVHSVPDRCVYSLMKPLGSSAFNLLAGFRERRRQDVAFLDHLILSLNGSIVKMEQGGRVRDGQQTLTLNATGQVVHGVELSKNQTGVTAKIPSINATVFFDGNTAHVTGHFGAMEGLCGNPADSSQNFTLSAAKSSNDSADSCETLHNQTADSSINCTRTTEYCNLIKQAPFTVCHNHSDPEPFVTACTGTLCKYPAVDGLNKCQFLEAYAESCRLKVTITVGNWRSNTDCSAVPQASCQDKYCSAHEFCGEKLGSTSCLCRAIFAAKYNSTNSLGEPTVCTQNSATLTLAGCLLTDKGIDYSALHLKDQNCTGHIDSETHMVTFSFNSSNACGAEVMVGTVLQQGHKLSVVKQIVSGAWNYTVTMNAYNDSGHKNLVNANTEVGLNQKIWVELKTDGLDNNTVAVVTDSCWASNDSSPNGTLRYDLVKNGCPNAADKTVMTEGNGVGTSNGFSFNMFEFSGKTGDIYLHCKVELCLTQSNACAPSCGGGRKRRSLRSKYADGNPALISMTWTK
ncbi:zonadhesin-like [Dicentrarchus labrax]|uniref:zonadhesin-like n=1 Tax=Dicentrarchus labrax TaxID=13489 RepID=UPI0021F5DD49|nr:zonadhesin-like [Dicentrarchus labrax]